MDMHTGTNWQETAQTLWQEGMAIFPVDEGLVESARAGFKQFLKRRDEQQDYGDWRFKRPGENEYDVGLIQRTGGEYDVKSFFHHSRSLGVHLAQNQILMGQLDAKFLHANLALFNSVSYLGEQLVRALDNQYDLKCLSLYKACHLSDTPYSTTILRSLYYPDGPAQTGAKAHIDRSLLTIHLGDQGGKLQSLSEGQWMDISPPEGYAVAFFGVKALWVTGGRKHPLRHRSKTFRGHDRFAFVHFGHVPLENYQVQDAQTAYCDWLAENTL